MNQNLSKTHLVDLSSLLEMDKKDALGVLKVASREERWDQFITGQAQAFWRQDCSWLKTQTWWSQAKSVLDVQSRNGEYFKQIIRAFPGKTYTSIESHSTHVKQCVSRGINCLEEDIEAIQYDRQVSNDVILLRLVLQHCTAPNLAVKNALGRLKTGGHLWITDAFDPARDVSRRLPNLEKIVASIREQMKKEGKNRSFSFEMYKNLLSDTGREIRVVFSNINHEGKVDGYMPIFQTSEECKRHLNNMLLLSSLILEKSDLSIGLGAIWEELKECDGDESYWAQVGSHYFVVEKV